MSDADKLLKVCPSPRLFRAELILENQKPTLTTSIDVGNLKQPNANKGETGGPKGLDPTRYGDWERNGRCIDF